MKKVCIIIVYFGKWPLWFNYFLKSCQYNSKINWMIYTDCTIPINAPKNIKFIKGNIDTFRQLVSKKLSMKIKCKNCYKICDFRPAFGIIFKDYLKDYDFWGFGDIDLIYGTIKKFVSEKKLAKYDIIATREECTTGPLTILRNSKRINNLYKKARNYKDIFLKSDLAGFDEISWNQLKIKCNEKFFRTSKNIQSFGHAVKFYDGKILKAYFKNIALDDYQFRGNWNVIWYNGNIMELSTGRSGAYFHFSRIKKNKCFRVQKLLKVPILFSINGGGIFVKKNMNIINMYHVKLKFIFLRKMDCFLGKIGKFLKRINPKMYTLLKKIENKLTVKKRN